MTGVHFFDSNTQEWKGHERFPDVWFQALETRETHPHASVMRVQVVVNGIINPHTHEKETETVFVLSGQGRLVHGDDQTAIAAGMGASIPPGIQHSVHNTGQVPLELIAIHMPPIR